MFCFPPYVIKFVRYCVDLMVTLAPLYTLNIQQTDAHFQDGLQQHCDLEKASLDKRNECLYK